MAKTVTDLEKILVAFGMRDQLTLDLAITKTPKVSEFTLGFLLLNDLKSV